MKSVYFRLFAIVIAVLLFSTPLCVAEVQYTVTDLGSFGGRYSDAYSINNSGQVVGVFEIDSNYHAFLWQNGSGMQDIGTFDVSNNCRAYSINDSGQVVGGYNYGHGAFLWQNGNEMQDLGPTTGNPWVVARGINNSGQVVGDCYINSHNDDHAVLWQNGSGMQDLGALGGSFSCAYGINNSGQVVGNYSAVGNFSNQRAFLYSEGKMTDIGTLGGSFSCAYGINNSGQVVGSVRDNIQYYESSYEKAFLWQNGSGMQDLGTLGGSYSIAKGINDSGVIVGNSGNAAFVYSSAGLMQNLNSLIPVSSGWMLSSANAINNSGQIVGNGISPSGQTHAFLLTPVAKCQEYQVQPPICAPINRLAKWDGTGWVPVCAGDLSSGNIHVLVHGWAPGLRIFADDGGKIWDATDPKTGSVTNADFAGILKNAAINIKTVAPGDIVVAFNWLDMSATNTNSVFEAKQSRSNTDESAADLTVALRLAGISTGSFNGKLQIVGISHGARVAAMTAMELYNGGKEGSLVVDQLTLGDSPDGVTTLVGASNNLSSVLKGINIGRTPGTTFIDNYSSFFGTAYTASNSIVNVSLYPPYPVWDITDNHVYPINWYSGASLFTSDLGLAWSPLEGDLYKTLGSSYEQDWSQGEYALKDTSAELGSVEKWSKLDLSTLLTQGLVTGIPGGMRLTEHSPAYWHTSFSKSSDDVAIEFTYQFFDAGDGDQLTLWIDDELRFVITGDLAGTDAFTTDIDISDLDAGYHILSVALNNYGDVNASVDVTDFTMVSVPEPSSLLFLFVGAMIFPAVAKLRRNFVPA